VVPLTLASGSYLRELGLLSPRGALYVARARDEAEVEAFMARFAGSGVHIERLDRAALEQRLPGVRPEWTLAIAEPACADIDVAGLHQHYLARVRQRAELRTLAPLEAAEREGEHWRLSFGRAGEARARVLVDAAGAWADEVAARAGARPLGITPFRRTVSQLRVDPLPPADLPLVLDLGGQFYFKPEHGKLWLSPHDETPSAPCDAAPEELDVAISIDRFEQVVDWRVAAVERKWAGLRSFAADRQPVYGYDTGREGFFWFAGQGGFGIQTAPAAARLAAQALLGMPKDAMTEAVDAALYAPARFG
jgi:D-arginine dehydrogenase